MNQQLALGRAIAEQRRRHGLSQADLARMLDRPAAWVSLVERGLAQGEPMPVLEAVASALGTPLPARHTPARCPAAPRTACPAGGPGADGPGAGSPGAGSPGAAGTTASALRLVLSGGYEPPRAPGAFPQGPTAAMRAGADRSWTLTLAGRYGELADLLSTLLPDLAAALRAAPGPPERAALHELVATCYQACSAALVKLGAHESAKTAASRALSAGQRAGDLPLAAAGAYLLARILMEVGRYPQAEETARKAAAALAPLAAKGRAEAISLDGALTLLRALISARTGDPAAAGEHLSHARDAAMRLAASHGRRDAGFGPAHVALYEIAVSVEASVEASERRRVPAWVTRPARDDQPGSLCALHAHSAPPS